MHTEGEGRKKNLHVTQALDNQAVDIVNMLCKSWRHFCLILICLLFCFSSVFVTPWNSWILMSMRAQVHHSVVLLVVCSQLYISAVDFFVFWASYSPSVSSYARPSVRPTIRLLVKELNLILIKKSLWQIKFKNPVYFACASGHENFVKGVACFNNSLRQSTTVQDTFSFQYSRMDALFDRHLLKYFSFISTFCVCLSFVQF